MPTINLLTWNLGKRDAALAALVKHVASLSRGAQHFVAAVQESTEDNAAIRARVHQHGAAVHVVGNGGMTVLCSAPLDPIAIPRDAVGHRLLLTRATFAGQRMAIVNYHGMARGQRGSPDETERGGIASEARWRIDEHAAGDSVIVLGDFNIEQDRSEIWSRHCFSLAADPDPQSRKSHNRDRQDLRAALPRLPPGIGGTYRLQSGSRGTAWVTLDFLAGGPGLALQTEALGKLEGIPLTDGSKPTLSDHLPVAGTLDLP